MTTLRSGKPLFDLARFPGLTNGTGWTEHLPYGRNPTTAP